MVRLFVGKGGAGKTTLAAKAAIEDARSGRRVLVVSFDQAHSLFDVLGRPALDRSTSPAGNGPRSVAEGLDVLELDTLALLEASYRSISAIVSLAGTGHEHGVRFGGIDPEEIVGAPGAQDLLGLHRLVELVDERTWDTVFVDLPATADALRTLALPDLLCGYLERLWPQHDRVVAGTGTDPRLTVLVAVMERVLADADAVRELLFDHRRTTATIVLTPDSVGVAEARRTMSAAALMGLPVAEVIVNKVLPELNSSSMGLVGVHPAVFWFESWRAAQQARLADVELLAQGCSLLVVEQSADEPVGLASLGALETRVGVVTVSNQAGSNQAVSNQAESNQAGSCQVGSSRPGGAGVARQFDKPVVAHESGSGLESVYTMTLRLPVVDPSTVSLGRVEDDVIIGADGTRKRVRLASVLRRCVVLGAEFESGNLVVRFRPDPALWPA
ncbi:MULTISPECIES: ArsA family ATPase [unclassified Rhodococcus (in: high G+C Gram-positive bacteria)]|uniref:ArsA family ATPase n=1 Tax=unclassified Rhodococcus (in: high G+C Gram-positive bacteria) TaxID=192944 RepID=UPI00339A406D